MYWINNKELIRDKVNEIRVLKFALFENGKILNFCFFPLSMNLTIVKMLLKIKSRFVCFWLKFVIRSSVCLAIAKKFTRL